MKSKTAYKRVMIALEGELHDDLILKYSAYLLSFFEVDQLFLLHVSPDLSLEPELQEKYKDVLAPKEENLEKFFEELHHYAFGEKAPHKLHIVLEEGQAFEKILRQCHIKDIDLLIMGRRASDTDHELIGARIAEQGPCSVLLIPETSSCEINEVFLPLDFSSAGQGAVHFSKELMQVCDAEVNCLHFFNPARGYLKSAEAEKELRQDIKAKAQQEWLDYKEELKLEETWTCELIENRGQAPTHAIFLAEQSGSDLIVISSKGRTASASVLMGSFAKETVRMNRKIPIIILKRKRENLDFFGALKDLVD